MVDEVTVLEASRLLLRPWQNQDRAPFAAMNADPRVQEFFPTLLARKESDAAIERYRESQVRDGFCLWAAELRETSCFLGFVGIQRMSFELPHITQPAVEIGWRLVPEVWGQGLATEGARAALQFAFETIQLAEVVAIAVPGNLRSRRVMEKLGMTHDSKDDFDHPKISDGHPFKRHVLYRIHKET